MGRRMNWSKKRLRPDEKPEPDYRKIPGPYNHLKRAPVKTWAQMTPEERQRVMDDLKKP